MYQDIFTNRWILGSLGFLIVFAGACYFWYQYETVPLRQQIAELNERTDPSEKQQTAETAQAVDAPVDSNTPTTEKPTTDTEVETGQETFNKLTHTDILKLPLEQRKQIFGSFYRQHGLKPPPWGYGYLWESPGVPLLDENGKPILHKRGEPIVELKTAKAFSPTVEEYEILKVMDIEAGWQKHQGNTAEAEQLRAEYDQLYSEVMRERPVAGSTIWVAPKSEKEKDPDKPSRMMKEKLRVALIAQGYSELIPILEEIGEL